MPQATDIDDVYFSAFDGLAEARAVFLDGCGLPDAWSGRNAFTVGELGFGSGLNLLALWDLWRRTRPAPDARLHMMSFEGRPLSQADAARALAAWPDLADLAEHLLKAWPVRARGVQRTRLPDGVTLTLHIDDIAPALAQADAFCDAWFLDGFSPAKNPDMWSPETLMHVGRMMRAGGRVGTFTVAGAVRRGLSEAGFEIAKRPGYGRKRERLEAVKRSDPVPATAAPLRLPPPSAPPTRVAIVGSGIAGAACARSFLARGCEVALIEQDAPAAGASGNSRALVMPRLDASDTPIARALLEAYIAARHAYSELPRTIATPIKVRHTPKGDKDRDRFDKLFADPPLDETLLTPIDPNRPGDGAWHHDAIILNPPALIEAWRHGAKWVRDEAASLIAGDHPRLRLTNGAEISADLIILANGMDAAQLLGADSPPLEGRLGQIETSPAPNRPPGAVAAGDYVIESEGVMAFGATFEAHHGGSAVTSDAAQALNLAALQNLDPERAENIASADLASRAGVRATTPDRAPLIGPVADIEAFTKVWGEALAKGRRHGIPSQSIAPTYLPGVVLAGGFGARGFTWAPWAAEILAAQAYGEPAPAERAVLDAVAPARFWVRAMKRGAPIR